MSLVTSMPGNDIRELYRELLLDHARNPRHFGPLPGATHQAEGINPLCGDRLHLYLALAGDEVTNAGFEGTGCAISLASASLLTECVIGQSRDRLLQQQANVTAALRGDSDGSYLGKLEALLGVREFPARVRCATLAWHALRGALLQHAGPVSTEH